MGKNVLVELLENGDKVSLYSPRFEGEDYTEFEKFLLKYKDTHRKMCNTCEPISTVLLHLL